MKLENVYPYTDLLWYAENNKLCTWNEAIDLLKNDGYIPFYESSAKEIYSSDGDDKSSENETLQKIIDGFCKKENVDFITIIDS